MSKDQDQWKVKEEEFISPTTAIPSITFQDAPPNLPTVRSQSFELPRGKQQGVHAHFENSIVRPGMTKTGVSHSEGYSLRRPSIHSRKSFARSVSSFSLYSHFAGERFGNNDKKRKNSRKLSMEETEKRAASSGDISMEEDGSDKSLDEGEGPPKASVGKAMFMFLKAFIGSGVLFLPKAFQHGGIGLSPILMIIIASICLFAFLRLVNTQLVIGGSYGDIGGILYGRILRFIVLFFIVISQIGFVCSYFIFVSGNLVSVVDVLSNCTAGIEQKYYMWMPLIILIPLALVRHIAKLSFTAIVADVFILFGLIVTLYFTAEQLTVHGIGPNVQAVNPANFALMIGTATFSFEGIGLIIPIVESMQRPERFPFVLTLGMIIVCVIYILIGTISYLAYGDTIQSAVIYNFPLDNPVTITVKILYSLAICLTAPLMLFPALKIIENCIFFKLKSGRHSMTIKWSKNIYRIVLCVICAAIAFGIGGENLDKFVSLVGSIACVPLCFIFPGMFHLKVSKKRLDVILNWILITFGVAVMIFTLYVSFDSFVHPIGPDTVLIPYCPITQK
ncbi:hypothetical protein MFLAVUS_003628 [Mucor flavus]|uniref:Amino acid transporter transmembrane domain-containing protein n=1 Tax=Mucor flavus TaxID=439312 RepID=A0ABP9YTL4_9FUNG